MRRYKAGGLTTARLFANCFYIFADFAIAIMNTKQYLGGTNYVNEN